MKHSSGPRKTANLSESIHQQLNMYALAASAVGVSVLALTQPAEAKIVYKHANVHIGTNQHYDLDFNHDGIVDFTIRDGFGFRSRVLTASAAADNGVVGNGFLAAALYRGAQIGSVQSFIGPRAVMVQCKVLLSHCSGQWLSVRNRYLGLKFMTNGKTHYGWARLSVSVPHPLDIVATLTGYAYETKPGKSIKAGQTKGAADDFTNEDFGRSASLTNPITDTPPPASLGMLVLGAQGVPLWRRKEAVDEGDLKGGLL